MYIKDLEKTSLKIWLIDVFKLKLIRDLISKKSTQLSLSCDVKLL